MSIATDIGRIATAKQEIKEVVNQDFNKITNETIDQYANKLQETYDEYESYIPWEHGEGSQIEFTKGGNGSYLEECNIEGDTEQDSYSGINLLNTNNINASSPSTDLTVTSDETGVITINGTSYTGNLLLKTNLSQSLNGTYTLIFKKISGNISYDYVNFRYSIGNSENTGAASTTGRLLSNIFNANSDIVVTTGTINDTLLRFDLYINPNVIFTNYKFVVYLVKGTYTSENIPNYEPYVGGTPSPNPDYPQDIRVVKDSNIIKSASKNQYGITSAYGHTYSNSLPRVSTGMMVIDNYDLNNIQFHATNNNYLIALLPTHQLKPNTDYIITYTRTNNLISGSYARRFIYSVDENNNYSLIKALNSGDNGNMSQQFTTSATGKIAIAFGFNNNSNGSSSTVNNLMIRLASDSDATFEPYKGNSYALDLHSKNLFDFNSIMLACYNSVSAARKSVYEVDYVNRTLTINSDNNDTFFPNIYSGVSNHIDWNTTLKPNTDYTISYQFNRANVEKILVYVLKESSGTYYPITTTAITGGKTFNTGDYSKVCIRFGTQEDKDNSCTISNIQLEEGNTATAYEPYYNYELYKISNYKDEIKKSTGKNLFNSDVIIPKSIGSRTFVTYDSINKTVTLTNQSSDTYFPSLYGTSAYVNGVNIPVKMNTDYTFSVKADNTNIKCAVYAYDHINNYYTKLGNGWLTSSGSINFNTGIYKEIAIRFGSTLATDSVTTFSEIQIEENLTATEYEPYGEKWYLRKEIGKYNLGALNYSFSGSSTTPTNRTIILTSHHNKIDNYLSNIFLSSQMGNTSISNRLVTNVGSGDLIAWYITLEDTLTGINSNDSNNEKLNKMISYLQNNNVYAIIPLATPTITEIMETKLINQLNAIEELDIFENYTIISAETAGTDLNPVLDWTLSSGPAFQKWLNNPTINEEEEI